MKYFVCLCMFEAKLGCGILKIERLIEEGFIDFDCSHSCDIQYTCANIKEHVCCIDLIEFGGEDLCYKCEKLLCSYFKYILIQV